MKRREFFKAAITAIAGAAMAPALRYLQPRHPGWIALNWRPPGRMILDNLGLRVNLNAITAWEVMPRTAKRRAVLKAVLDQGQRSLD